MLFTNMNKFGRSIQPLRFDVIEADKSFWFSFVNHLKVFFQQSVVEDSMLGWLDFTATKVLVLRKVVSVYYYFINSVKVYFVRKIILIYNYLVQPFHVIVISFGSSVVIGWYSVN